MAKTRISLSIDKGIKDKLQRHLRSKRPKVSVSRFFEELIIGYFGYQESIKSSDQGSSK